MKIVTKTHVDTQKILSMRGLGKSDKARKKLAAIVKTYSDPYVPFQSGPLKNTAQIMNGGRYLLYNQPYAHYQYTGQVMSGRAPKHYTGKRLNHHGAPKRGPEWDRRMMADRGDDVITAFAKAVGGKRK